jgi:hypothetical protein
VPTWLIVVLCVLVLLVIVFAIAGDLWNRRHRARTAEELVARVSAADHALSDAVAADHGWDRALLEAAAREAFVRQHPALAGMDPVLVLVDDRPGTDEDRAVFEILEGGRRHAITLLRTGDRWNAELPGT